MPFVKLEEATEFFKKYGFEVESSEQLINISETNYEVTKNRTVTSKFSLYVSRYKKISSRLKELDYKQKKHIGDGVEITRKIGEILGYPSCCINYYVKMSHIYGKKFNDQSIYFENIFRLSPYESSVKKNFLLNNFVNYGYINFFVCDYNCIKAIEIAKENRSLLEKFIDVNGHDG